MKPNKNGLLTRFIPKLLRFYLFSLFSFTITCLAAIIFGAYSIVVIWLPSLVEWFLRLTGLIFCFIATAIIYESLQG